MYYYLLRDWEWDDITDEVILKHRRKFTSEQLQAELKACEEDIFYPKGRKKNQNILLRPVRYQADQLIAKRGFVECPIQAGL